MTIYIYIYIYIYICYVIQSGRYHYIIIITRCNSYGIFILDKIKFDLMNFQKVQLYKQKLTNDLTTINIPIHVAIFIKYIYIYRCIYIYI